MMDRPLYYRWVFNPQDGSVLLSHNDEDEPANVKYHTDLAQDVGARESYHGYAYRIGRGWRLTDWEHKALDDPFVATSVLRKLRDEEGHYHPHPELDWQEIEEQPQDFDRFHYGLPMG